MPGINEDEAVERLREIAGKHNLDPEILRRVIEGKSRGWTHKEIAHEYGYNKNTVSKYNKKLEKELSEDDLGDLLIVIGVLLGGAYLLSKLTEDK